jgi:hypothetical protein
MFTTVNYLLHEKRRPGLDPELLENFNPFITTKSFSFYNNGQFCNYINDTLNVYSGIFKSREAEFRFFENLIPRLSRRKSEYIKKGKRDPVEASAVPEFYSRREIEALKNYDERGNTGGSDKH